MLQKTAGGPQPRQRDIIHPAVAASKQHRARELLQTDALMFVKGLADVFDGGSSGV
jgi:hypothetical protein